MFSARCTNPSCASPFDYRRGRLFRFHEAYPSDSTLAGSEVVRHYWLCDWCSQAYTLQYANGTAVLIRLQYQSLTAVKDIKLIAAA